MSLSKIEIINDALRMIGDTELKSLTENTPQASRASSAWKSVSEYCLTQHAWSFAKKFVLLASTAPLAFGYAYAFSLPSDFLKIIGVRDCPNLHRQIMPYALAGGAIVTNYPHAYCEYIYNADVSEWHGYFYPVVSARLAFAISKPLDRSDRQDLMYQFYLKELETARFNDNSNQKNIKINQDQSSPLMLAREFGTDFIYNGGYNG